MGMCMSGHVYRVHVYVYGHVHAMRRNVLGGR